NEDGDSYEWEAYDASGTTIGAHSGSYVARIHYNSSGCDDWLITPKLVCDAGTADTLVFWAASYSSYYMEDFEVRVSTTGNDVASFGAPVYSVTSHANSWLEHKIPLDAYDGNDIYVAVRCISVDAFYLYLDDFTGPEVWVPAGPAIAFNTTDLSFGTVGVGGSADLPLIVYSVGASNLTVSGVVSDNGHFTHDFPGTTVIPPGDSLVVTVTFTPTAEPEETGTLTVTHDGEKAESFISMSGSGFAGLLFQDFSGTFPPAGWAEYQLGDPAGWVQGTPGYDDTYCAYHNDDNVATACDDWLVTPQISLPAKATYELEFMQYEYFISYYDYHGIMISTGSGDPNDGQFVELMEAVPEEASVWKAVEDIGLAAYAGQDIYLAF
ncbi:choice-of-anchor J domain-containing protein, partial [bacterium]|nr:choice-of-anchor J domain-containing protein [bacterium]